MTHSPTEPDSSSEADELDALRLATIRLSFDRDSPSSLEAAIRDFDARIDFQVAPFSGNAFIKEVARQIKSEFRESLLQHIAEYDAKDAHDTLRWRD